ncbi:MAG TPA: hypothetical protein ENJ18_18530 [Nannocystis exedens]|nr:hypothetical protein [Nannocystis exedens]
MTFGALLPASTANAANVVFGAMSAYNDVAAAGGGSVLDLEGDEAAAAALTTALRREFAARGIGGGKEMSALELKLTMGCDEPPAPACMAEGGKTIGVSQMVYGGVVKAGDGFTVNLTLLDVEGVAVQESLSVPLAAEALGSGVVDQTAKDLVDRMLGAEPEPEQPADIEPSESMPVYDEPVEDESGGLVWGRHDAARWKKVGLATSAVLTVAAVGTGVATGMMIVEGGLVQKELIDAAEKSLEDDKASNDIDPYVSSETNLCDIAETTEDGQRVTNAEVATVCRKGKTLEAVSKASFIGAGIFGLSTIVFTTLLFVHRKKTDGVAAKLRSHGAAVGISPTRDGGAMVRGRWRF